MKSAAITLLTLLCLSLGRVSAQTIMVINIVDRLGVRDSVTIGTDIDATRGIDLGLGELDLSGNAPTSTDIRSVMEPQMCVADSSVWPTGRIYETKLDLRDSMFGIRATGLPVTFNSPRYGVSLNDLSKNSFNLRIQCSSPPCTLFISHKWPLSLLLNDRFKSYFFGVNLNGTINCSDVLASSTIYLGSSDTLNSIANLKYYLNFIYFSPGFISIPKSLAEVGMKVTQGYLVHDGISARSPASVEIIDPLGRTLFTSQWPLQGQGEERLALSDLHGVLLLRLRYDDGRMVVLRHGFD